MTKVYNPTESTISIQYRGVSYSIEAGETKDILAEAASYWKDSIHSFIVIEPRNEVVNTKEVEEAPVEEVTPEVEAVEEVVAEEVAPKKSKK